jgi:hypothetical protein
MPAKPIPYGLSDYKLLITKKHAYVDKTMYIRSLEQAGYIILFLRPRRFGKSLFASMLGHYYDIAEKDNFDLLFSNTDIGKNPTEEKNAYHVLKFNFSGLETDSDEILLESFTNKVHGALLTFRDTYQLDLALEMGRPAAQLSTFFREFRRTCDGKIYVIIDEYDHFANELLSSNYEIFKETITGAGFVRKFYEILKEVGGTIVERIFITGVSPITLDSLTSGFFSENFSMRGGFNEMVGFTRTEIEQLIQETLPPNEFPPDLMNILTEYYNGYCFSKDGKIRVFNSDMVLYYLKYYQQEHKPPEQLLDQSIASDYGKLGRLIEFANPKQNREILAEIIFNEYTTAKLIDSFSSGQEFDKEHFKSLFFYLGLLTIKEREGVYAKLQIPNTALMGLYFNFLIKIIARETHYEPDITEINLAVEQLAYENEIDKLVLLAEGMLHALSNEDYKGFNEKYVKFAMVAYSWDNALYNMKSEYQIEGGKYVDLAFLPKDPASGLATVLFEFKYIKNSPRREGSGKKVIDAKLAEAIEQLKGYSSASDFSGKKISAWAVVFVKDECVRRVNVHS